MVKPNRPNHAISALERKRRAMVVLLISSSIGGERWFFLRYRAIFIIRYLDVFGYASLAFVTGEIFAEINVKNLCS